MGGTLRNTPILIPICLAFCLLMAVPIAHAVWLEDWKVARTFLYTALFFGLLGVIVALATSTKRRRHREVSLLLNLFAAYLVVPAILAVPVEHLVPAITYAQAYFEMLSSLTTTGATVFSDPTAIADPLHLWRATVSWAGGLMILVAALAVLEPINLGGFEIQAAVLPDHGTARRSRGGERGAPDRLVHHLKGVFPPYLILTLVLAVALLLAGERTLVAVCHAMSVLSTSGISPLPGLPQASSGYPGEIVMFLFLFAALSHRTTSFLVRRDSWFEAGRGLDPEYRIALICASGIALLLFIRHFWGAIEVEEQNDFVGALRALWGGAFTTLSFLSTTGFESADWAEARSWSGLSTPGMVLLGLCLMGGGVASTCGGVKLLRIYVLYKHGQREVRRLIHPNSVGGAGVTARRVRREGAAIAWIFLMLFILGIAVLLMLFTATGLGFETSLSLSISSLTTTGPAVYFLDRGFSYGALGPVQLAISGAAMILGRLELLVFVALFNPDYWRQ